MLFHEATGRFRLFFCRMAFDPGFQDELKLYLLDIPLRPSRGLELTEPSSGMRANGLPQLHYLPTNIATTMIPFTPQFWTFSIKLVYNNLRYCFICSVATAESNMQVLLEVLGDNELLRGLDGKFAQAIFSCWPPFQISRLYLPFFVFYISEPIWEL